MTGNAKTVNRESEVIGYEQDGSSAVFRGKYKLAQNTPPKGKGEWELYGISKDPSELINLVGKLP
jgi:hypothetical protein